MNRNYKKNGINVDEVVLKPCKVLIAVRQLQKTFSKMQFQHYKRSNQNMTQFCMFVIY